MLSCTSFGHVVGVVKAIGFASKLVRSSEISRVHSVIVRRGDCEHESKDYCELDLRMVVEDIKIIKKKRTNKNKIQAKKCTHALCFMVFTKTSLYLCDSSAVMLGKAHGLRGGIINGSSLSK